MSEIKSFSDYASIKNGSYGKLLKAYYAKQDADKKAGSGDSPQKLTMMKTGADALQKSDISTLKSVFTGYQSFAGKVSQKATSISNAANRAGGTYTSSGTYSKTLATVASTKIDKEV